MIYIRIHAEQAAALKGLCQAAGLNDIVSQIDSQRLEVLMPTDMPALAIWREQVGPEEVWNETVADAMYEAMQKAWSKARARARSRA